MPTYQSEPRGHGEVVEVLADGEPIGRVSCGDLGDYWPLGFTSEEAPLDVQHTLEAAIASVIERWKSDQLDAGS